MGNGCSLQQALLPLFLVSVVKSMAARTLTCGSKIVHCNLGALLLDFDGTICETEKEITLEQFNEMFRTTKGLEDVSWSSEVYGELLTVGASQARLSHFFDAHGWPAASAQIGKKAYVDMLKHRKDDMFDSVWQRQKLPALPGVVRLIDEALSSGDGQVKVAVVSNSNLQPVTKMCLSLLGPERISKILILTGDMPAFKLHKKPDPKLYVSAAEALGVAPDRCVCIEDSSVGLAAAKGAGMLCIVTPSYYTKARDDFSLADMVVSDLEGGGVRIQ